MPVKYYGTNGGGGGAGLIGGAEQAPADANANPNARPDTGEESQRQDVSRWFAGWSPYANGGDPNNPCGFPGYGEYYNGSYANYRFILKHPEVAHVSSQVKGPILVNQWGWEVRKGSPDAWLEFARDVFMPLRLPTLREGLRAIDFGHYGFEKVWGDKAGRRIITKLKPLAVENAGIMVDEHGTFAGLRYGFGTDYFNLRKSFLITYDGEAGELYGRSRLENFRETAWRDWLDCAQQLMWLSYKITGKLAVITTPSGSFMDGGNPPQPRSWRETAMAAGRAIANPMANGVVWFPTAAIPNNNTKENLDLMKIALVNIDVKDFGDHAPAIVGFLERMRANEALMSKGYLRSPRTNMESKHGSRADSDQHTDTDTVDCELIEAEFAEAFCAQVVDDVMVLNFGERARGAIRCKPAALRDDNREADFAIIDGIMVDPIIRPQVLSQLDLTAIFERRGTPIEGKKIEVEYDANDQTADGTGDESAADSGGAGGGNQGDGGGSGGEGGADTTQGDGGGE